MAKPNAEQVDLSALLSGVRSRISWFESGQFQVSKEQVESGLLYAEAARALRNGRLADPLTLEAIARALGRPGHVGEVSVQRSLETFNRNAEHVKLLLRELQRSDFSTNSYGKDPGEHTARIRERRRNQARDGLWPFEVPVGYRMIPGSKLLQVDPKWGPIVKSLFERVSRGEKPRAVAENLGFDLSGGKWSKPYDILHGKVYQGVVELEKKSYPGKHQPLVSPETWNNVQMLLRQRRRKGHLFGLIWDRNSRHWVLEPGELRLPGICRLFTNGESVSAIAKKLHVGQNNVYEALTRREYAILGDVWRQANQRALTTLGGARKARGAENMQKVIRAIRGKTRKMTIVERTGLSPYLVAAYLQRLKRVGRVSSTREGFGKQTHWYKSS